MKIIKGRHYGVTLIEIMISFLIFCSAVISVSGMLSFGHKGVRADFRQGEAMQILVDRLNTFSVMPYSNLEMMLGSAKSVDITDVAANMIFGNAVVIGQNKYQIHATLKYQEIRFDNLMELKFPNTDYLHNDASTWLFKDRDPRASLASGTEIFDGFSGFTPYSVIKITVRVKPVGEKRNEREVSAITFVANLEE